MQAATYSMPQVLSSPQPRSLPGIGAMMAAAAKPSEAALGHGEPSPCLEDALSLPKAVDASSSHPAPLQLLRAKLTLPTGFTENETNALRGANIRRHELILQLLQTAQHRAALPAVIAYRQCLLLMKNLGKEKN